MSESFNKIPGYLENKMYFINHFADEEDFINNIKLNTLKYNTWLFKKFLIYEPSKYKELLDYLHEKEIDKSILPSKE